MAERYLCIHAHFYQPPRENPWLEVVEQQDSAYPYHDWNERITAECYAPNSASRMLSGARITQIVSNYSKISFNFGPTLLSWMEQNTPEVYGAILEADRASAERFGGHGSAIAQVYNHMILPLATRDDKRAQVLWGIADFEYRFGRKPEGMWLAETAVDVETLEVLAEAGIQFTILAPHQAARMREFSHGNGSGEGNGNGNGAGNSNGNGSGSGEWTDVSGAQIDPTRAYLQRLPSGRSINLFFYDGPIARAVAFEGLLANGEGFANRLLSGFSDQRPWPQLVHIATDGETYGHHHKYGDMALAYALDVVEREQRAQLTNYGQFLQLHPPQHEVEVAENTSWSCAHGVRRWHDDCGCNSGGHAGWNQKWRGPLRAALDGLRDQLAPRFGEGARALLKDPWAARNAYIQVVLDRSPESLRRFFEQQASHALSPEERVRALKLLEMQRHLMLMYTSCGWFFDELTGIETVQVILYAGRALQLAEELFGDGMEAGFLEGLAAARSNLPAAGAKPGSAPVEGDSGRDLYQRWVKPTAITLNLVGAHYAISSLFTRRGEVPPTYCYTVARLDYNSFTSGRARLALGRALVTSRITEENAHVSFAVLHLGDNNVTAGVRAASPDEDYSRLVAQARQVFECGDVPGSLRLLDQHFEGAGYSLKSLFRDEQRRIVEIILAGVLREAEATHRQVYEHHAPLMRFLLDLNLPLPRMLHISEEVVVNAELRREFARDELDLDKVNALLATAQSDRIALDSDGLSYALKHTVNRNFRSLLETPQDLALLARLDLLIALVQGLPFEVNLWRAQNIYYQLLRQVAPEMRARQDEESRAWLARFEQLGERLSFDLSAAERAEPAVAA